MEDKYKVENIRETKREAVEHNKTKITYEADIIIPYKGITTINNYEPGASKAQLDHSMQTAFKRAAELISEAIDKLNKVSE